MPNERNQGSSIVIFIVGLLLGLGIGYFLFSNDPDNILVLENGKFNNEIDNELPDSLIVFVPLSDSAFTIDITVPQQKPIYLLTAPGRGFISSKNDGGSSATLPVQQFDQIFAPGSNNLFLTDYLTGDVEQICKITPTKADGTPNIGKWILLPNSTSNAWDIQHEP